MGENFYRRVFQIGALWNLGGGCFILLATGWIFSSAALAPPDPPLYYRAWIALFMVFGIGYWQVSRDLRGNRNIAFLGMVGKIAFAIIFLHSMYIRGDAVPRFFLIPVAGDLVFAWLHWMLLRFLKTSEARA